MVKKNRIVCFILFIIYISMVIFLVFSPHFPFKLNVQGGDIPIMIKILKAPVFYIPFQEIRDIGFWLNIILTVPFGAFLCILFGKRLKFIFIFKMGFIVGMFIESIQFILDNLIPGFLRYVDINDLISNTFGVVIGYYSIILIYKTLLKFKNNTISR